MNDQAWVISGLAGIVLLLLGVIISDQQRRIKDLENHIKGHDEWARDRAVDLERTSTKVGSVEGRLARMDEYLDRIWNTLNRLLQRGPQL